jgi:hypothetical protein
VNLAALYICKKNTVLPNFNFHKFTNIYPFSRNLFFLPVWTTNNAQEKIASYELFDKKSFMPKQIHVASLQKQKSFFFVKKSMRGFFECCLSSGL